MKILILIISWLIYGGTEQELNKNQNKMIFSLLRNETELHIDYYIYGERYPFFVHLLWLNIDKGFRFVYYQDCLCCLNISTLYTKETLMQLNLRCLWYWQMNVASMLFMGIYLSWSCVFIYTGHPHLMYTLGSVDEHTRLIVLHWVSSLQVKMYQYLHA